MISETGKQARTTGTGRDDPQRGTNGTTGHAPSNEPPETMERNPPRPPTSKTGRENKPMRRADDKTNDDGRNSHGANTDDNDTRGQAKTGRRATATDDEP